MYLRHFCTVMILFLTGACATPIPDDPSLWEIDSGNSPHPNTALNIPGLGPCTDNPDRTLHLDADSPTIILAHGCFASAGRFRALSQVFAFHGQQTACFNYNDRDSLMESSAQLIQALQLLADGMRNRNFTIIGHSQGGLISRKALVRERTNPLTADRMNLRLVTISSPFSGIAAASHCGSTFAKIISLGLVVPICYVISGDKWYEITSTSDFIRDPGTLVPQVDGYLKIVTDERGTCLEYDASGNCIKDDYVFSVAEQYHAPVDNEGGVTNIQLNAGHAEIVGDRKVAPVKLIDLLQQYQVMNRTVTGDREDFESLLVKLYDLDAAGNRKPADTMD